MAETSPDEWDKRTNAAAGSSRRFSPPRQAQDPPEYGTPSADLGARLADITAAQVRRAPGAPGASVRFLLAHLLLILSVTLVTVGGAALLAWSQTPVYQSAADVVVEPATTTASSQQALDMGTEKGLASSGTVIAIAAQSLGVPEVQLDNGLSVSVPVDTDLLRIAYSYPNRHEARRRAQGIATAYVFFRSPAQAAKRAKRTKLNPVPQVNVPQAAIVTNASLPKSPASPNHLIDLIVAVILGLGLGIGIALIRDRLDDHLRGPQDFEQQAGTPVLALIPPLRLRRRERGGPVVTVSNPDSLVAEAHRGLRTRVLHVAASRRAKTLLVTSPAWEERASIAANLALDNHIGLTTLRDGRVDLEPALRITDTPGLLVLPAGPAVHDPAAVLQGPAFRRALGELRNRADFVVVDGPPVLASAEIVALAELTEMLLLVGDTRQSTRAQVRAAIHELDQACEKLIGCVLDNVGRAVRLPRQRQILPRRPIQSNGAAQGTARPDKETVAAKPWQANAQAEADKQPPRPARTNAVSGS